MFTGCKDACLKCFIDSSFAKSIFFYQQKRLTQMQWHWNIWIPFHFPRWNQPLVMKWTNLLYYIMALWTLPATCTVWSHETHSASTQSNVPQPMSSLTCTLIIYWPQHQQCVYNYKYVFHILCHHNAFKIRSVSLLAFGRLLHKVTKPHRLTHLSWCNYNCSIKWCCQIENISRNINHLSTGRCTA
jgi:hypothetical protein